MIILPILKIEKDLEKQIKKITEECLEVLTEYTIDSKVDQQLSECWDLIQATLGYMHMIAGKRDIELAAAVHFEKLRNRNWEFKGFIEMSIKE